MTTVLSQTRLSCSNSNFGPPTSTPLSIIDAVVANYSTTAAAWFYDRPETALGRAALVPSQLELSLRKNLDSAYPQLYGQLGLVAYDPEAARTDHRRRFNRLELVWGGSADPGVEFVVATSSSTLASHVPTVAERSGGPGTWNASEVKNIGLLPQTPALALANQKRVAVAVKMSHPIADAQTLLRFVTDWAATNLALVAHLPLPTLSPIFDPSQIDSAAAGDIDAPAPDPTILALAAKLPAQRHDWWASSAGHLAKRPVPPELASSPIEMGKPIPWSTIDFSLPCAHTLIYFSPAEIDAMYASASSSSSGTRISRLDALLSHIWRLIIRGRNLSSSPVPVHLDMSLGLRSRLSAPLPSSSLGSPIVNMAATAPASTVALPQSTAPLIRSALTLADPETLSAFLHERAHALDSQRYWDCFLGERHTIVTSWLGIGMYEVEFGEAGKGPRFANALLGDGDGMIQLMEAGDGDGGKG